MAKRDRAAYMRAYRAERAEGEGVSAPPPVRKLRDRIDGFHWLRTDVEQVDVSGTIQATSQAERDRILRKRTK